MKLKLLLLSFLLLMCVGIKAQPSDTTYVYLKGGGVDAYPSELAKVGMLTDTGLDVVWGDETVIGYAAADVERVSKEAPDNLPLLSSFKVNNKYNDQVYSDVEAEIKGDDVNLAIGCIGKWLTPSFQLSDDRAVAYIGDERQWSKKSRRPFDHDITYTVALPEMRILRRIQLTDDVWSSNEDIVIPITLTAEQLSTNAPSNYDEGLDKVLDGNPNTFFHSTWGEGPYQKLPENECPYIDIRLDEPIENMRWVLMTRSDADRMPRKLELLASVDGISWRSISVYTTSNGLPVKLGGVFVSPTERLGEECRFLRIKMLEASYKNYFCVAELRVVKVILATEGEPQLIEPATYRYEMQPFGRDYRVHVDWLSDKVEQVPVVRINTNNGKMISSKTTYLDAQISIDGAGVFPSMPYTPVQVRGRGNSSWSSNQWDKNPYRLKFDEKKKPFGLTNGKNWVLLANKLKGSMMCNAVGMKAACLAGTVAANHMVPVELYINGQYRGSYNFTEKLGFSNNSIDLEDETYAVLLELDTYYDEVYKFKSNPYSLPVNIKEPDFSEGLTGLTLSDVVTDFNSAMNKLKRGVGVEEAFDLEYLARYLLVNELIENFELMHPKSTFLYKENVKDGGKYIFGPVWDLDWAFSYELRGSYCLSEEEIDYYTRTSMEARQWVRDLRYVSKQFDRVYYKVWTQFMTFCIDELLDFCDDYYAFAHSSFENNSKKWDDGSDYASTALYMKEWIDVRAKYVYQHLTPYDLAEEELEPLTGLTTPQITELSPENGMPALADVYDLKGFCVKRHVPVGELRTGLTPGIYIVNGKKMYVK